MRAGAARRELRTEDLQTVASGRYAAPALESPNLVGIRTLSTGGRTFTLKRVTRSAWPGIAETISRDRLRSARMLRAADDRDPLLRQLLDEAGTAVLYRGGRHFNGTAGSYVKFPGQRWLRFPVRGTTRADAIMTAVDQAGNKIARYRLARTDSRWWKTTEIAVHPGQQLTEELVLAIAVSAPWLSDYLQHPG